MYLNVMLTVVAGILVIWFLYETVFGRLIHKPTKAIAKVTGHSMEFYDVYGQIQSEFQKGHFEQVLTLADGLLAERPYESSALKQKAYALYHLKRYDEAKELLELLDILPDQDVSRMLEKIDTL